MFLRDAKRTCIDCIIGNCEERSEATRTPTQNLNGNPSILGELTYGIGRRKTAARSKITSAPAGGIPGDNGDGTRGDKGDPKVCDKDGATAGRS